MGLESQDNKRTCQHQSLNTSETRNDSFVRLLSRDRKPLIFPSIGQICARKHLHRCYSRSTTSLVAYDYAMRVVGLCSPGLSHCRVSIVTTTRRGCAAVLGLHDSHRRHQELPQKDTLQRVVVTQVEIDIVYITTCGQAD